jgi:hypothetical protein
MACVKNEFFESNKLYTSLTSLLVSEGEKPMTLPAGYQRVGLWWKVVLKGEYTPDWLAKNFRKEETQKEQLPRLGVRRRVKYE